MHSLLFKYFKWFCFAYNMDGWEVRKQYAFVDLKLPQYVGRFGGMSTKTGNLALDWKSVHSKVGFRLGAVTCTFHVIFNQLEAQKCDPYRFYCLTWGCSNRFIARVYNNVAGPLLDPRCQTPTEFKRNLGEASREPSPAVITEGWHMWANAFKIRL